MATVAMEEAIINKVEEDIMVEEVAIVAFLNKVVVVVEEEEEEDFNDVKCQQTLDNLLVIFDQEEVVVCLEVCNKVEEEE